MPDLKTCGRHPVKEALQSGAPVRKIYLAQGSRGSELIELIHLAEEKRIPMQTVPRPEMDRLAETDKHQGILALMPGVNYVPWQKLLDHSREKNEKPALLLLDGVEDPRNLGAILRVADGAGMHGVIITKRRCAEVTAAAVKTSAGAAFHIPIAQETNLNAVIEQLKRENVWIVGCDMSGEKPIFAMDANMPLALVLGGEGMGLHQLVRKKCDFVYRIPMRGKVDSLNVSTAAAIVCYEVVRQRLRQHSPD
ncbi:MAG: 23S rRNA (guanosine(2251)-2'-O)-methyltransferase RlmB [candidate division KSB1 bacterium]|nr:23S rRNA (guanosine(2251)-2'-O)-methyltransferase RlmB [candidate division KSB1 bacterium]MDZ7369286.1 23S rRNA (guanosine(2251)-2'-O)-methyltransferase RlmB [candidate division KSB1 bacterium]MDZ7407320.1 23S rRNA (guanosine(2251)-2'-O)-methyltransferase RlmB [candidate division KSB1 bacterium]